METTEETVIEEKIEFIKPEFHGIPYFGVENKKDGTIRVEFTKLLNDPKCLNYEIFHIALAKKRMYKSYIEEIVDDNNRILNHRVTKAYEHKGKPVNIDTDKISMNFLKKYLAYKINLDRGNSYSKLNEICFVNQIINLFNNELLFMIKDYVDSVYLGCMDDQIDMDTHIYKVSTTLFDVDIKELCNVKYACLLVLPICIHFCKINQRIDITDLIQMLNINLFDRFNELSGHQTKEKIYRWITSIVHNAYNKNRKAYEYIKIEGITKNSETEHNYSKVLTSIIIKLEPTHKAPSYLATTVKKTAGYNTPRKNLNYTGGLQGFNDYAPHNAASDDTIVSEAERIESKVVRPDESLRLLRKYGFGDLINKLFFKYEINAHSEEELHYAHDNLKIHNFQRKVITQIFCKDFCGVENFDDMSKLQYNVVALIAEKILRARGHNIIADYFSANYEGHNMTIRINEKDFTKKLNKNPKYDQLLRDKYRFASHDFLNKGFVKKDCVAILNNTYSYGGWNNQSMIGNQIIHNDEVIIDAMLDYYLDIV